MKTKRFLAAALCVVMVVLSLTACSGNAGTSNESSAGASSEASDKNVENVDNSSIPEILVCGEKVSFPLDCSVFTKNGYTFASADSEETLLAAKAGEVVEDITFINEGIKQSEVVGNPSFLTAVYCEKEKSLDTLMATSLKVSLLEKQYFSVNGLGINDKMSDFLDKFGTGYVEFIGTVDKNLENDTLLVEYSFDNLRMQVNSYNGTVDMVWIYLQVV